mgnify:CR=1 FL=1
MNLLAWILGASDEEAGVRRPIEPFTAEHYEKLASMAQTELLRNKYLEIAERCRRQGIEVSYRRLDDDR